MLGLVLDLTTERDKSNTVTMTWPAIQAISRAEVGMMPARLRQQSLACSPRGNHNNAQRCRPSSSRLMP